MSFELALTRNRTFDYSGTITDANGTAVTFAADDVLRFKLYRRDAATPALEVDNVATANGSVTVLSTDGDYTLRIAQADTASLVTGPWEAELMVSDNSETSPADAAKHVEHGTVHILGAPAGDIGV